jgi:hypothetical protein
MKRIIGLLIVGGSSEQHEDHENHDDHEDHGGHEDRGNDD